MVLHSHIERASEASCFIPLQLHKCAKCKFQATLQSIAEKHRQAHCAFLDSEPNEEQKYLPKKYERDLSPYNVSSKETQFEKHASPTHKSKNTSDKQLINGTLCLPRASHKLSNSNVQFLDATSHPSSSKKIGTYKITQFTVLRKSNAAQTNWLQCALCTFKSKERKNLAAHVLKNHEKISDTEQFQCEPNPHKSSTNFSCPYRSKDKHNLKRHIQRSHMEVARLYKCEKCTFESKWPDCLVRHVKSEHTDCSEVQLHKCEKCSYTTTHQEYLRLHHMRQPGRQHCKQYQCVRCPFRTEQQQELNEHYRTESHSPSFTDWHRCEMCPFKARHIKSVLCHSLNQHKVQCPHCPYKARDQSILKQHLITLHLDLTNVHLYHCQQCSFKSKWRTSFTKHVTEEHISPASAGAAVVALRTAAHRRVAFQRVAPQTVALQTVALQTVRPRKVAPQTVALGTVVPQTVKPQTVALQTVVPQTVTPQTMALQTAAPQRVALRTAAPQTVASQTPVAQKAATRSPIPLFVDPWDEQNF